MKKTFVLLLVTLLLVGLFAACSGNSGKYAAAGDYVCTSMTAEGLTLDPSALGLDITLTLKNDGTGALKYAGEEEEDAGKLTWIQDGNTLTLTDNGETITATVNGKTVTMTVEGAEMVFTKK